MAENETTDPGPVTNSGVVMAHSIPPVDVVQLLQRRDPKTWGTAIISLALAALTGSIGGLVLAPQVAADLDAHIAFAARDYEDIEESIEQLEQDSRARDERLRIVERDVGIAIRILQQPK